MKKVLIVATVASHLRHFDKSNTEILKEQGYEIDVATNFGEGNSCPPEVMDSFKKQLESIGARWYQIDFSRNMGAVKQNMGAYKSLLNLVKENDYDFIHCHTPIASAICRLVSRKTHTKTIYTAHGFHFYKGAPFKHNTIIKSIERFLAHYTDVIITINEEDYIAAKKFRLRKGGQVKYIPGVGIDTTLYKNKNINVEDKRKQLNIPSDAKILITVAELILRKNYPVALEAVSQLPDDIFYIICGDGPLEEPLKRQADDLGISDRVKFLGYRTDVHELMKVADVFLFTTSQEGLPVALMEAMRAGLPAVVSDVRGNRDLIDNKKGGILCNKDKPYEFAKAVNEIIYNKELMRSMEKYNENKIQDFSIEKVNSLMAANYKEIVLDNF